MSACRHEATGNRDLGQLGGGNELSTQFRGGRRAASAFMAVAAIRSAVSDPRQGHPFAGVAMFGAQSALPARNRLNGDLAAYSRHLRPSRKICGRVGQRKRTAFVCVDFGRSSNWR